MRHRQPRAPLSARLAAAVGARTAGSATAGPRPRRVRLGIAVLVLALVTGFVLLRPVVAGSGGQVGQAAGSPIVPGVEGPSSSFAGASARLALGDDGVRVESATSRSARTAATAVPVPVAPPAASSAPAASPAPAPAAAPEADEAPPAAAGSSAPPPPAAPAPAPAAAAPAVTQPAVAAPPAPTDRAGQVLALANQARAAAGCRPLTADDGLAAVAGAHSADMRDQGFFDHVNLAGLSPFDRAGAAGLSARAENIARGQADAAAVMDAWMTSPGHRANILDCSLARLGVGIADGGGGPWWTQLFG